MHLPSEPADADAVRRRRILFRATHRGTYENDILIGGFVRLRLSAFTAADLDALEAVIYLPDAMLVDRAAADPGGGGWADAAGDVRGGGGR